MDMEREVIGAAIVLLQRLGGSATITREELDQLVEGRLCFWFHPKPEGVDVEVITEEEAARRQEPYIDKAEA